MTLAQHFLYTNMLALYPVEGVSSRVEVLLLRKVASHTWEELLQAIDRAHWSVSVREAEGYFDTLDMKPMQITLASDV
jgi:hypothetical protein